MGIPAIRIFFSSNIIVGYHIVGANYFQVTGKPKYAITLNLLRILFLVLPLIVILPIIWEINGVWWSKPTADFIASFITYFFLRKEMKKLDWYIENENKI